MNTVERAAAQMLSLVVAVFAIGCTSVEPLARLRDDDPANVAAEEAENAKPPAIQIAETEASTPSPPTPSPTPSGKDSAAPDGAKAQLYTCVMHPEVRVSKPGACPKCGMTLVPVEKEGDGR